jgi:histone chaperone ASF1
VTVILLSCSYDDREFVRVGYYVNNEYTDQALNEEPPAKPEIEKIRRNILADKPRVTRFQIKWDSDESAPSEFPPEQPDVDNQEDDETQYGAEELEDEDPEAVALEADGEEQAKAKVEGEDADMDGVEANGKNDDEESNAGSEDLEAESEDDDDEDDEEEGEAEAEAGDEMEMDDAPADHGADKHASVPPQNQQAAEMMVH